MPGVKGVELANVRSMVRFDVGVDLMGNGWGKSGPFVGSQDQSWQIFLSLLILLLQLSTRSDFTMPFVFVGQCK